MARCGDGDGRSEPLRGDHAVAMLRPIFGGGHLDPRWDMAHTNGRVGLVAMLATSARRSERFDTHIPPTNRDGEFIGIGHFDQGDRRAMSASLFLCGRDSLHTMRPDHARQQANVKAGR